MPKKYYWLRKIRFFVAVRILSIFFGIRPWVEDTWSLWRGRHKSILNTYEGRDPILEGQGYKRAAVIALYPTEQTIPFTINLMKGFVEAGFYVLAVSAAPLSPAVAAALLPHCHKVIEKINIGRDFGSYHFGVNWILDNPQFVDIEVLAIANDSLFYPRSITETIRQMMEMPGDWLGLYENFPHGYHVGSYFEIFRAAVIRSVAFRQFWRTYRPLSFRPYVIKAGEQGLSATLKAAGFSARVLYSRETIMEALRARQDAGEPMAAIVALLSLADDLAHSHWHLDFKSKNWAEMPLDVGQVSAFIKYILNKTHPTHSVGLLCNVLLGAPIKCDIVYRACVTTAEAIHYSVGFTAEETTLMRQSFEKKGCYLDYPRWTWNFFKVRVGVM